MYTPEDLRELDRISRKFVKPHGRFAWKAWIGWILCAMTILGAFVSEWFFPRRPTSAPIASTASRPPVFVIFFWPTSILLMILYLIWSVRRRYVRQLRDNPLLQVLKVAEFTDAGVTFSQPSTSTSWAWGAFAELVESNRVFALRIKGDKRHFLLIPKRAVPADELEPFRSLVQARTELEVKAFPVLPAERNK
jgi:hypothetical protein